MPKSGARKVVKPVAATVGILGTMASIWWFALKPRRKAKSGAKAQGKAPGPSQNTSEDSS
jgi:hypothetical protein